MKKFIIIILLVLFAGCNERKHDNTVFVSVLPLKYFTEHIAGDNLEVDVMVPSGMSPATYEPLPAQMLRLNESKVLFSAGVPFEQVWLDKIKNISNRLIISPVYEGIDLHEGHSHGEGEHEETFDPHIWSDPVLAKKISENILLELSSVFPDKKEIFRKNYEGLILTLDSLHYKIKNILQDSEATSFMIFHPALGYYAARYGLHQIALEVDGKEPSPSQLKNFIDIAKSQNIKQIFVQKQFATTVAESIANELGLKITVIDPLSDDYVNSMLRITELIAGVER